MELIIVLAIIGIAFVGTIVFKSEKATQEDQSAITDLTQKLEQLQIENKLLKQAIQLPELTDKEKKIVKSLEIECKAQKYNKRHHRFVLTAFYLEMHKLDNDREFMHVMDHVAAMYKREQQLLSVKEQEAMHHE